jgi:hypothetical protein
MSQDFGPAPWRRRQSGPARNETGQRILKFRISGNFFWAGLQNDFNVICPVQSPRLKIFRLTRRANHRYDSRRLTRTRGVAHVTNARWDAVDATASGAQMESQGGSARERSAGARTNDAATRLRGTLPDRTRSSEDFGGDGRGRRSRVVCWRQVFRRCIRPTGPVASMIREATVATKPVTGESAK